ncbi:hypothetical protein ACFL3C_04010 [Patescibacteria group bacterium]
MTEKEGQSPADRIGQYLEDHPELTQNDSLEEPVKIEGRYSFSRNLIAAVRDSVSYYLQAEEDELLMRAKIDESVPLYLHISRGSKTAEDGQHVCNALFLEIKKEGQEKNVAEFALRDYGDEFRFSHRKVDPNYRGNGIATAAMNAMEEFVKEISRKVPGREAVIEANAAQLDVLKWFDRNGFETTMDPVPVHPGENPIKVHNIDDVLMSLENEDEDYLVGPYMYVFPEEHEGSYFDGKGEEPENVRIDDSALVHFRKKLDVETEEDDIGEIMEGIKKASTVVYRKGDVYYREAPISPDLLLELELQKEKILSDIAILLEEGGIEDDVDQKIVREAIALIENPSENLEDIMPHTTNVAQVLAGYMMQGAEEPPEIDAMHGYLLALQCINRVKFAEEEFAQESPDVAAINKAYSRGVDWAKTLDKGYRRLDFPVGTITVMSAFHSAFKSYDERGKK